MLTLLLVSTSSHRTTVPPMSMAITNSSLCGPAPTGKSSLVKIISSWHTFFELSSLPSSRFSSAGWVSAFWSSNNHIWLFMTFLRFQLIMSSSTVAYFPLSRLPSPDQPESPRCHNKCLIYWFVALGAFLWMIASISYFRKAHSLVKWVLDWCSRQYLPIPNPWTNTLGQSPDHNLGDGGKACTSWTIGGTGGRKGGIPNLSGFNLSLVDQL